MDYESYFLDAKNLLKSLIATPSFSKEEDKTAELIEQWFQKKEIPYTRENNNVWAVNKHYDPSKETLLLNSHHDTVKPNSAYTLDPFSPIEKDGKLYGLGSNDAGGCLVSLMAVFAEFYNTPNLAYNLLIAASAEEEISGKNGVASLRNTLPKFHFAMVGEPTSLNVAIAEKGLIVIDAYAPGTASHSAHQNNDNAILNALTDIQTLSAHKFSKTSDTLGDVKVTVAQIQAGKQHNVVPDVCHFVIDVRVNEKYSNQEVLDELQSLCKSRLEARSLRLNASGIDREHPLLQAALQCNLDCFGSPTLSDQALLPVPSIKIGPGDTTRSHTADEFIYTDEIKQGIISYHNILTNLLKP